MPNRILRAELWDSDRFLDLPDNTHRVCYVRLISRADDLANLPATDGELVRLWRDFGVESRQKAAAILSALCDADLVRLYDADGKRFAHLPRFNQRVRHVRNIHPASPWNSPQKINDVTRKTSDARLTHVGRPSAEEKRREEKKTSSSSGDDGFAAFWQSYPRRIGKAAALKAWHRIRPNAELAAKILAAVESQKRSQQWLREQGKFIPHPTTWLNQGRWDDDTDAVAPRERKLAI